MSAIRRLWNRHRNSPQAEIAASLQPQPGNTDPLHAAIYGYQVIALEYLREHREGTKWRFMKRAMIVVITMTSFAIFVTEYFNRAGTTPGFLHSDAAAVVTVRGAIGDEQMAKASAIIPRLTKAFRSARTRLVILRIDTPGGSPTDAERIYKAMNSLKAETGKPVVAVIEGVGASAGYMIAMHADKVYSGQYSLVGSIGAFLNTWDASQLIEEHGVKNHTFASGPLKTLGSTFARMTNEQATKAQAIVDHLGAMFAQDFVQARDGRLTHPPEFYRSGEVWHGDEALALGLTDGIRSVEDVAKEYGAPISEFGPVPASPMVGGFVESLIDQFAQAMFSTIKADQARGAPRL